jgi:hypothetical protein
MNNPSKVFSKDNIPEELKEGSVNLTILECKNESVYDIAKYDYSGLAFFTKHEGRFFIKAGKSIVDVLSKNIEE